MEMSCQGGYFTASWAVDIAPTKSTPHSHFKNKTKQAGLQQFKAVKYNQRYRTKNSSNNENNSRMEWAQTQRRCRWRNNVLEKKKKKKNGTMRCKLPQCHPHCCIGKACRCHQMIGRHTQPPHPPHAHTHTQIHTHTYLSGGGCGAFMFQYHYVKCF